MPPTAIGPQAGRSADARSRGMAVETGFDTTGEGARNGPHTRNKHMRIEAYRMSDKATNFGAVDAGSIKAVPLECVTVSYNVRGVLPRLDAAGFPYARLLKMSIGTPEERAEFVRLVESARLLSGVEGEGGGH